ncbi:SDR family NAD(P)-dependent oxidoreductase [Rhodococcus sp. OK302]|uniref:SDR family NAD(P)-dependent oxidoreductase n=1 Tax=Rhodococcus sp. OK302 TaxID=1882769 RepID=UPI000B93AED1|nr:SDR family NAD(P)-dependent oxidoreductase [Rhodococcus sp. OK302]OYD61475.1 3-oxoacyl-[acyl-carrier protein] reductase [Rhodococcus sp. OK302]
MNDLLNGRTAVVTGAARGLGLAMARGFLEHGATVVLADLDEAELTDVVHRLGEDGLHRAVAMTCDVSNDSSMAALAGHAADMQGGLDIWVNNAGILRNGTMAEVALEDFKLLMDVHVQGSWLGCKYAGIHMGDRTGSGSGSIINISSIGGKAGLPGQTSYSTAKSAILGLTKAAAKELAPRNIRVNTILPGIMRTAMAEQLAAEDLASRLVDVPLGRIGEPHEIADAAVYLASDMSSFVTGAALEVSGGRFM